MNSHRKSCFHARRCGITAIRARALGLAALLLVSLALLLPAAYNGLSSPPKAAALSSPLDPAAPASHLDSAASSSSQAAGAPRPPLRAAEKDALLARIDSLRPGLPDSAWAIVEPLLQTARAEGDSSFLLALLARQGSTCAGVGQSRRGELLLREALTLAKALADSEAICISLHWLGLAVASQGRTAEAAGLDSQLLSISRSRGDRLHEGWALVGFAWQADEKGYADEAAAKYRRASELFVQTGSAYGQAFALLGLGRALSRLGAYQEARGCYRRAIVVASEIGVEAIEEYVLSSVLNNLGALEFSLGDPGAAEQHFRRAYELQRQVSHPDQAILPALNIAICQTHLGHLADAARGLERLAEQCREGGYAPYQGMILNQLAKVRDLQGRHHESAALYRRSLALGDALPVKNRVEARIHLSEVLGAMDSSATALGILEDGARLLEGSSYVELMLQLENRLGQQLLSMDRHKEALRCLLHVDQEERRLGLRAHRVGALTLAAAACHALGLADSALALLEEAARVWESDRSVPLDPEWREARGAQSRRLYTELAALLLTHPANASLVERTRAAYDRLQIFKARTLMERMLGPGKALDAAYQAGVPEPATLEKLQQEVLKAGELLLDAFLGQKESFLFAVTREECRAVRLAPDERLGRKLQLYCRLLSTPPGTDSLIDSRFVSRIGCGVSRQLLGELADLIARCDRILVAPDGELNLLPFGALPLLPATEGSPAVGDDVMVAGKEVVRIPSATFLAWQRGRTSRLASRSAPQILAVAADRTDTGEALPGAVEEVRRLARCYSNVDKLIISGDSCPVSVPDILGFYDVLHLAAHARGDDQSPWRSTIRFCRAQETANPRADRIAAMRLPASLAVLSSCESAGGRILSGEGVQGLSSAFLSAGVPAVVATLWAVDDRSTAKLMEHLYEQLAEGKTVAGALRSAQMALRESPGRNHPYFWAGFVLVGDGEVRVHLDRRRNLLQNIILGILILAVLGLVARIGLAWSGRCGRG